MTDWSARSENSYSFIVLKLQALIYDERDNQKETRSK